MTWAKENFYNLNFVGNFTGERKCFIFKPDDFLETILHRVELCVVLKG